jgi:hypothetical protein
MHVVGLCLLLLLQVRFLPSNGKLPYQQTEAHHHHLKPATLHAECMCLLLLLLLLLLLFVPWGRKLPYKQT